jgi:glycosyltransferase involved in cell wall biosynthesis
VQPVISIIVPCYNQAQYLDECLQSVFEQTFSNWECIIVNDGSQDNTEEIATIWSQKDNRFVYLKKENGGLSNARNSGIEIAKSEFILPLDADDKIGKEYCQLALDIFKKDSSIKIVYCKAEVFGEQTGYYPISEFSLKKLCQKNIIFCTAFFKKSDWKFVGGFDENLKFGLEDWEFWIAILKNGGTVYRINEILFYYRIKSNSMLKNLTDKQQSYSEEYISLKHADFFIKNLGSFSFLENRYLEIKTDFKRQTKSKKYVLNLFFETFFKFKIFKEI